MLAKSTQYQMYSLARISLNSISNFSTQSCKDTNNLLKLKILDYQLGQAQEAATAYWDAWASPDTSIVALDPLYNSLVKNLDAVRVPSDPSLEPEDNMYNDISTQATSLRTTAQVWEVTANPNSAPTGAPLANTLWGANAANGFEAMQANLASFSQYIDVNLDPKSLKQLIPIIEGIQADFASILPLPITPTPMSPQQTEVISQLINLTSQCSNIFVCSQFMPGITAAQQNIGLSMFTPDQMSSITNLQPLLVDFIKAIHTNIHLLNLSDLMGKCTSDATESYGADYYSR